MDFIQTPTKLHKKLNAQILVVILVSLAILSIFIVIVATNARRDFIESAQNRQYEQAITVGEEKLVLLANGDLEDDCSSSECTYDIDTNIYTYTNIKYDETSDDVMEVKISQSVSKTIENLQLDKDRSVTIKLKEGNNSFTNQLHISWTDKDNSTVLLEFNVDYINNSGEYKTAKELVDPNDFNNDTNQDLDIIKKQDGTNGDNIHTYTINLESFNNVLALRIKAIMPNVSSTDLFTKISVVPSTSTNYPNQVSLATAETRSISSGQFDTPVAILELQKPLHDSPFEIFDYVLRSQGQIVKEL